jgi:glycosyltransferase involved in cell wall biosynthesis
MLDQLLVGAAPGDAITRSALLLQDALAARGPAAVYALHVEPGMEDRVRPLGEMTGRPNRARPVVFHASIGSWPVHRALDEEPQVVLVYHNISPPEQFVSFSTDVADDLIRGRWELERLRPRVVASIADSDYNAEELRALGYVDIEVIPPTPDVDRLNRIVPDPRMLERIDTWGGGPVVLCVAQLLPHKRIERVLAAVAVLQQEHVPDARLGLVGVERFPSYSRALRVMASVAGLREPHFLGRVTDAELSSLYLRARAFLTLSDHEGFCVPVVEAMATGVPVVASRRAAIPSTVGDAGILVDEPDDPVLVAGVVDRVLTDERLRRVLLGRGMARAKDLSARTSLPRLVDAVTSWARREVSA